MMNILVINTGSSSIKYKLFAVDSAGSGTVMAEGMIDRIGEANSIITHDAGSENKTCIHKRIRDYTSGIHEIARFITGRSCGVISVCNPVPVLYKPSNQKIRVSRNFPQVCLKKGMLHDEQGYKPDKPDHTAPWQRMFCMCNRKRQMC